MRAIAIDEKALGPEHPDLATDYNNLANLYTNQGRYQEAEPLYQRAIAIRERVFGPEHPFTVQVRQYLLNCSGNEQHGPDLLRAAICKRETSLLSCRKGLPRS